MTVFMVHANCLENSNLNYVRLFGNGKSAEKYIKENAEALHFYDDDKFEVKEDLFGMTLRRKRDLNNEDDDYCSDADLIVWRFYITEEVVFN